MSARSKFLPTPYDLTQPAELIRLLRECRGYLRTCRRDHHGTDFQGREFAMEAIEKICNEERRMDREYGRLAKAIEPYALGTKPFDPMPSSLSGDERNG